MLGRQRDSAGEDLFIQAQTEYLRGHWCETESLLQRLVSGGRDVEAHLSLAALYRQTKRCDEARSRLRMLERLDGAEKWRFEIERERQLLERMRLSRGADETRRSSEERSGDLGRAKADGAASAATGWRVR